MVFTLAMTRKRSHASALSSQGLGHGSKADQQTFVCAWCQTNITGEVSLVEHCRGRQHRDKARGRAMKLLPNSAGIIPELSTHAREEIGLNGTTKGFSLNGAAKGVGSLRLNPTANVAASAKLNAVSAPLEKRLRLSSSGPLLAAPGAGILRASSGPSVSAPGAGLRNSLFPQPPLVSRGKLSNPIKSLTPQDAKQNGNKFKLLALPKSNGAPTASAASMPRKMQVATGPPDLKTFVCKWCRTNISGEISLVQHVAGQKHKSHSRGRKMELLPNASGIIPPLSRKAELRIGCKGGPPVQEAPKGAVGATQTLQICDQSERLLRQVLSKSGGSAGSSMAMQGDPYFGHGENDWQEGPRGRQASVPRLPRGSRALQSGREALPVWDFRAEIVRTIARHQVVILEGETGCGKTTQVGQYVVDHFATQNSPCSVVCTQPRRISAISVAERVAEERGEAIGDSVGYSVRLESKSGPNTCLVFCTTGILLRRLESDPMLNGTTHVIIDEVHERGVESDFLLLAMRDLCQRRRDVKVVLMSATMDKSLFSSYFGGTPSISVPGRTFPVKDIFLEQALDATGHQLDPRAEWAAGGSKGKGKGKLGSEEREELDAKKREDLSASAVQSRYGRHRPSTQAALRGMNQDAVNYDLLVDLIRGRALEQLGPEDAARRPSGVLVFMSGAREIEQMQEALWKEPEFSSPTAKAWVLPLHGGLPTADQRKVFVTPPQGVRKIVIATNVAETAVTINDIGYVVDTCRMKEMRYDPVRCMSALEDTVVSRTNARQRRGRAGRVAPGLCVHVGLTKHRHDRLIDDHQPPEVQRTSLEHLVLRIHAAKLHLRDPAGKAAKVCARLIEPPKESHVAKAVEQLVRLGALEVDQTGREALTPLGHHLARLPIEARLGKLALLGCAFGPASADAALTIAAALTSRNPFVAPLELRDEANRAKKTFADRMQSGPVGLSDHLAVLGAYQEWNSLSRGARYEFCRENFLSFKTLEGMAELKRSLLETLSEAGFVRKGLRARDLAWSSTDGVLEALSQGRPSRCPPALLAALLCAALFPQVATARMPPIQGKPKWGKTIDLPKPKLEVRDAETGKPIAVKLHPGSVSSEERRLSSPYLVYQELVKSTYTLYVRDVTPVPPLALVLFGSSLQARGDAQLVVDGWVTLAVPKRVQELLLLARQGLDDLFLRWVSRQRGSAAGFEESTRELLDAIVELLSIQEECALESVLPPSAKSKASKSWEKWSAKAKKPGLKRGVPAGSLKLNLNGQSQGVKKKVGFAASSVLKLNTKKIGLAAPKKLLAAPKKLTVGSVGLRGLLKR